MLESKGEEGCNKESYLGEQDQRKEGGGFFSLHHQEKKGPEHGAQGEYHQPATPQFYDIAQKEEEEEEEKKS